MIAAKKWRVEVYQISGGSFTVRVQAAAYLPKAEFKRGVAIFRRNFMDLADRWRWYRIFKRRSSASVFAAELARKLGETAYVDDGELCLVMPGLSAELVEPLG